MRKIVVNSQINGIGAQFHRIRISNVILKLE